MASADNSDVGKEDTELPVWLAKHLSIDWLPDDIDALLTSIDASQSLHQSTLPHLPAELLLLILEHIPVAYILDWRLVCRGFRDAIDGPILYHLLQRAQLIGYLGPKTSSPHLMALQHSDYEQLHLIPTRLQSMDDPRPSMSGTGQQSKPPWANKHTVFKLHYAWSAKHRALNVLVSKSILLSQIALCRTDQAYGTLTWIIKLDTAVLDLDLPLEPHRRRFDFDVDMKSWTLRVEWKPMMFRFLKTERALRLLMDTKSDSKFTFNHAEDCLRAVRRQALHAALDPDSRIDRHIKWSLRLLRPLWGINGLQDSSTLDPVEADAVKVLLLMRREASLSQRQIIHLWQLASDYKAMLKTMDKLSKSLMDLKRQLLIPGHSSVHEMNFSPHSALPLNPIAWSEKLLADVQTHVQRWKTTQGLVEQMQQLILTSQEALAIPEEAFDVSDSQF